MDALAEFGPWQAYALRYYGAGLGWDRGAPGSDTKSFRKSGTFSTDDDMVQEGWSDPWGIGFGWDAEIHPIEIADFVVGTVTFGFVDISRDDFGNPNRSRYKIGLPVDDGLGPRGKVEPLAMD